MALGKESAGALCWDCLGQVKPVQIPFCERCGDPVSGEISGEYECSWCRQTGPAFDWARSAVRLLGPARGCLRRFKYHGSTWVLGDLVRWLTAAWRLAPVGMRAVDAIVPVPLYPRRERERGYNQASLLAAELARAMGVPIWGRTLWRVRPTATQTRLTAAQRAHNVRGVFRVPFPRRVQGARIVLVDDVMTTGATVNECARTLKAAGAAAVMVLTVARG